MSMIHYCYTIILHNGHATVYYVPYTYTCLPEYFIAFFSLVNLSFRFFFVIFIFFFPYFVGVPSALYSSVNFE